LFRSRGRSDGIGSAGTTGTESSGSPRCHLGAQRARGRLRGHAQSLRPSRQRAPRAPLSDLCHGRALEQLAGQRVARDRLQRRRRRDPSVPMSLETVAPRYLCTDGRRMVPQACRSQPQFLVERPPPPRASASRVSPA
jgi:hypothetical protein